MGWAAGCGAGGAWWGGGGACGLQIRQGGRIVLPGKTVVRSFALCQPMRPLFLGLPEGTPPSLPPPSISDMALLPTNLHSPLFAPCRCFAGACKEVGMEDEGEDEEFAEDTADVEGGEGGQKPNRQRRGQGLPFKPPAVADAKKAAAVATKPGKAAAKQGRVQ